MSTELSPKEFREKIRRSFRGLYWDPKHFKFPEELEGGGLGPDPENPFPAGSKVEEKELDPMKIGIIEQKQFDGKAAFNLKVKIPFIKHEDFLIVENNKKENDSHPDWIALQGSQRVGALWKKKTEKKGDILSGYIESPVFPDWRMSFAIIKVYKESGEFVGYEPIASKPEDSKSESSKETKEKAPLTETF